ncbi:MAG: hypothetical protein WCG10_02055 [Chlamydiota bacterium]
MIKKELQFLHYADVKRYLKKRRKRWGFISLFGASMGLFFALAKEPQYMLEATFKEAAMPTDTTSSHLLKTLFKTPGSLDLGTPALTVMRSRQFLKKVIEKSGIQAEVVPASLYEKVIKKIQKKQDLSFLRVAFCKYSGVERKRFYVELLENEFLKIVSLDGNLSLTHHYSQPLFLQDAEVVLSIDFNQLVCGKKFLLEIYPMQKVLEQMTKKLKLKLAKGDSSLIELAYQDKDPYRGVFFLNSIMQAYKHYLVEENERIAQAQLIYLSKRQNEIATRLDETLQEHVKYLKETLGEKGFMSLHQELEIVENKKKKHQQRLMEIDLDIDKLSRVKKHKLFACHEQALGQEALSYQQRLLGLKQQKDTLDLGKLMRLSDRTPSYPKFSIKHLNIQPTYMSRHLMEGKEREFCPLPVISSLKSKLRGLYQNQETVFASEVAFYPLKEQKRVKELKRQLAKELNNQLEKEPLLHLLHLLDVKEGMLKYQLEDERIIPVEFQGIDLATTKRLHENYTHELDVFEKQATECSEALKKIQEECFEPSGLIAFTQDSLSQELVKDMMQKFGAVKQQKYFSDKDRIRLKQELDSKKQELQAHLMQKKQLAEQYRVGCEHKLVLLQQVMSNLINQEIVIVEKQMEQILQERLHVLKAEKHYVDEELDKLQQQMQGIPQKWLIENKLQLQSDMNVSIMEAMVQLVESKNIEHHLVQVESKAMDEAYVPLKPVSTSLLLGGVLGGFLTLVFFIGISLFIKVYKGFPLSLEGMCYRGFKGAGVFSKHLTYLDGLSLQDLEVLRKQIDFIAPLNHKCIGVILNNQIDYIHLLIELLALSGKKGVIAEYESSRYSVESLSKLEFESFLLELQKDYDKVFLVSKCSLNTSEAYKLRGFCQSLLITLDEESIETLYPYIEWENEKKEPAIMYVSF